MVGDEPYKKLTMSFSLQCLPYLSICNKSFTLTCRVATQWVHRFDPNEPSLNPALDLFRRRPRWQDQNGQISQIPAPLHCLYKDA